jgi:hypothetical protein
MYKMTEFIKRFTFYWMRPSGVWHLLPMLDVTIERVSFCIVLGVEARFLLWWSAVEIDLGKEVGHE